MGGLGGFFYQVFVRVITLTFHWIPSSLIISCHHYFRRLTPLYIPTGLILEETSTSVLSTFMEGMILPTREQTCFHLQKARPLCIIPEDEWLKEKVGVGWTCSLSIQLPTIGSSQAWSHALENNAADVICPSLMTCSCKFISWIFHHSGFLYSQCTPVLQRI